MAFCKIVKSFILGQDTFSSFGPSTPLIEMINDYDNRIVQLDNYLKETFSILEKKGFLDNAIVVITSDHGQGLGEQGHVGHCISTFPGEISIPFLLYETGENTSIQKVKLPFANQVDIAPTIIDLLKLPKPKTWEGSSIFNEDRPEYIFQHEDVWYSCIWTDDGVIYQYLFNKKSYAQKVFDLNLPKNKLINIIDQIDTAMITKAKSKLKDFYAIKPPTK